MPIITIQQKHAHIILDRVTNCELQTRFPSGFKDENKRSYSAIWMPEYEIYSVVNDLRKREVNFALWGDDGNEFILPEQKPVDPAKSKSFGRRTNKLYKAFGESTPRPLAWWAKDSRCRVSLPTLRKRVVIDQWQLEKAMLTEVTKSRNHKRKAILYEAWGERHTIDTWSKHPKCKVSKSTLQSRIFKLGHSLEQALTTPLSAKSELNSRISDFLETLDKEQLPPPLGYREWSSRAIAAHLGSPRSYNTVATMIRKRSKL